LIKLNDIVQITIHQSCLDKINANRMYIHIKTKTELYDKRTTLN